MTDLEPLEFEDIVEINREMCATTGEHSALLDAAGLEAALERPWSGFGAHETFPTVYAKAAALLHGIASRQVFENGNKRTAWAAAVAFLEINGLGMNRVETVQADMFVRAAALDHTLEVSDLAEWFEVAHREDAEPSLRPVRWGINRLGIVGLNEHGAPVADHFRMMGPGDAPETPIFAVDDTLTGWTVEELHIVLHGNPCVVGMEDCAVAARLQDRTPPI